MNMEASFLLCAIEFADSVYGLLSTKTSCFQKELSEQIGRD